MDSYSAVGYHGQQSAHMRVTIKNLRLLDLDEEFDWPDVRPGTFSEDSSVTSASTRISCANWILFKLFEIWDLKQTKEVSSLQRDVLAKCIGILTSCWQILQPHFPSFDEKSSTQLHKAFSKCLYELKKAGLLRRETIVDHSLLHDCKGLAFERLLVDFSTRVLYKRAFCDNGDGSIIQQNLHQRPSFDSHKAVPLRIAYRRTLGNQLSDRAMLERRWHRLQRTLDLIEETLQLEERSASSMASPKKAKKIPRRVLDRVHKHLQSNWEGNRDWVEILVQGDQAQGQNTLLERRFDEVWGHAAKDTLYAIRTEGTSDGLLRTLERRVHEQSLRLERWKSIRESMSERAGSTARESSQRTLSNSYHLSPTKQKLPSKVDRNGDGAEPIDRPEQREQLRSIQRKPEGRITRSKAALNNIADEAVTPVSAAGQLQRPSHSRSRTTEIPTTSKPPRSSRESDSSFRRQTLSSVLSEYRRKENLSDGGAKEQSQGQRLSSEGVDQAVPELKSIPSLAERTRMTMALASPAKERPFRWR